MQNVEKKHLPQTALNMSDKKEIPREDNIDANQEK